MNILCLYSAQYIEISKFLSLAIYVVNFLLILSIELNTGPYPVSP